MKIRIPNALVRAWERLGDWSNVPVFYYEDPDWPKSKPFKPKIEIRRIDVILALGFVLCVAWYALTSGWQGAVLGGVLYLAMWAMALWLL